MARSSARSTPGKPRHAPRVTRIDRRVLFHYGQLHSAYRVELHVRAGGALHDSASKGLAGIAGGVAPHHLPIRFGWSRFALESFILSHIFHTAAVSGYALWIAGARRFTILSTIAFNIPNDDRLLRLVRELNNICPGRRFGSGRVRRLCLSRGSA